MTEDPRQIAIEFDEDEIIRQQVDAHQRALAEEEEASERWLDEQVDMLDQEDDA